MKTKKLLDNGSRSKSNNKMKKYSKPKANYNKFIGNREEGQGFADKRKRKIKYEYFKLKKKERLREKHKPSVAQPDVDCLTEQPHSTRHPQKNENDTNINRFSKNQKGFQAKLQERMDEKKIGEKKRKEYEEAMGEYNKKKKKTHLKLCKKTRRGQPVMQNQIEFLLEKIQGQVDQT
ncbi:hypothetical protein ScPMuIL_016331 [Solemya velum]